MKTRQYHYRAKNTRGSYACGPADLPLIGATTGAFFDDVATTYPNNEAVVSVYQNIRLTYRKLKDQADALAGGLLSLGVEKGDRVAIWSTNSAEWVIIQLATAKIGAIIVPINTAYQSSEVEYALKQSGSSVLFISTGTKYANYGEIISKMIPELTAVSKGSPVKSTKLPDLKYVITFESSTLPNCYSFNDVIELGKKIPASQLTSRQEILNFDDPVSILFTSGTTGYPKGATLTHHNILNNGYMMAEIMRITHKDRLCVTVPYFHCFGLVACNLVCLTHGATLVIPSPQFDAGTVLQCIQNEKCTVINGVPTMFIAELQHPDFTKYDLSSLRTGIMAGAPCPVDLVKKVIKTMGVKQMTIAYGMTETSPATFQTRINASIKLRTSTVGTPLPWVEAKIVGKNSDKPLPIGQAGELCVRGFPVMAGYWKSPDLTRGIIDENRWLHTGDLAVMNENGYINIVGRAKEIILRGGENIFPGEIEDVLRQNEKVAEAYVIGVPNEFYGEETMAWIKLKPGESITEAEIKAFCKTRIAYYKVPTYIKFVSEFPMTSTGKVQKTRMRELAINELGLEKIADIKTA